ncbi:hypothetical protein Tco_1315911 [Tanacetum coccineum]
MGGTVGRNPKLVFKKFKYHVPTDRAELTDVSESSDGAESSDGEHMFDQPSKKKKFKTVDRETRAKEDHLCWQKWDSDPVNSHAGTDGPMEHLVIVRVV